MAETPRDTKPTYGTADNGGRGKEEHLHNSDGREEKLETSRGDGKQRASSVLCRYVCMALVVLKVCTGLA